MGRSASRILQKDKTELICTVCNLKLIKNSKNFIPRPNLKFSHGELIFSTICRKCWNFKVLNNRPRSLHNVMSKILVSIRSRAKKNNIPVDVDIAALKKLYDSQEGRCALTGIPLSWHYEAKEPNSPRRYNPKYISIDKIDPKLGYIKSNLQFVCNWANMSKGTLSTNDFLNFCEITLNFKKLNQIIDDKTIPL